MEGVGDGRVEGVEEGRGDGKWCEECEVSVVV